MLNHTTLSSPPHKLEAGLMSELASHPSEIAFRSIHYLERDDLRDLVGVQALDFGAQFLEQRPAGLDDQQYFFLFFDGVLPAIHAASAGNHVDAGREPFFNQRTRELLRL